MSLGLWLYFWGTSPYCALTSAPYAPAWCPVPNTGVFQPNIFQNPVFQVGSLPGSVTYCALTSAPYAPVYCATTSAPYWPG
jgi:hypothetical protein